MDSKREDQLNLSMIFAMGSNRVIGRNGRMPWNLPGEMAYFRRTTWGHPVLMGRKNVRVDRQAAGRPHQHHLLEKYRLCAHSCSVIHSVEQFFLEEYRGSEQEIFVIGGEQIYRLFLPYANRLFMTLIHHEFEGDAYFPEVDEQEWEVVSERKAEDEGDSPYDYSFLIWEKKDRHTLVTTLSA